MLFIGVVVTGALSGGARGQGDSWAGHVRAEVTDAREQWAAGEHEAALALLKRLLREPGMERDDLTRAIVNAELGYSLQQLDRLDEALDHYEVAHSLRPDDLVVVDNLVLLQVAQGQVGDAMELLSSVVEVDDPERLDRLALLGDLRARVGDRKGAIEAYMGVLEAEPARSDVAGRLIRLYAGEEAAAWLDEFNEICRALHSMGHVREAGRGWGEIVVLGVGRDDAPTSVALLHWAETEAERGTFGEKSLSVFSGIGEGKVVELDALRRFVLDPMAPMEGWPRSVYAKHVAAMLMASVAESMLQRGSADQASRLLEHAVFDVAPDFTRYEPGGELQGKPVVRLDAALRLASLLNSRKDIEDAEERFGNLQSMLVSEKTSFYPEQDLDAMQAYHVVLAQIYVERGEWKEGIYGAPYHLERAIDVADRRAKKDPERFEPLPQLRLTLAEGLVERDPARSQTLFREATEGFLTVDDVAGARGAVERWERSAGGPDGTPTRVIRDFRTIIKARESASSVGRRDPDQFDEIDVAKLRLPEMRLGADFVADQNARILRDLSDQAITAKRFRVAAKLNDEAMKVLGPGADGSPERLRMQRRLEDQKRRIVDPKRQGGRGRR
jgi:tetratricopeptide (TPR) repeat protein